MWIFDSNTRRLYNDYAKFNKIVEELEENGRQDLLRQGMKPGDIKHKLELDMRYGNQLATTTVVAHKLRLESIDDVMTIIKQFSVDYGNRFGKGSEAPEAGIRINTVRVQSYVELETVNLGKLRAEKTKPAGKADSTRKCHFVGHEGAIETAIHRHEALDIGSIVTGPAVVVSAVTTYLVEPGWSMEIGEHGAAWFFRGTATAGGKAEKASSKLKVEA
jgi:N-methylhydantoinase A